MISVIAFFFLLVVNWYIYGFYWIKLHFLLLCSCIYINIFNLNLCCFSVTDFWLYLIEMKQNNTSGGDNVWQNHWTTWIAFWHNELQNFHRRLVSQICYKTYLVKFIYVLLWCFNATIVSCKHDITISSILVPFL